MLSLVELGQDGDTVGSWSWKLLALLAGGERFPEEVFAGGFAVALRQ